LGYIVRTSEVGELMPNGLELRDRAHLAKLRRAIEFSINKFIQTVPLSCREQVSYSVSAGHRTRGVACLLACESVGGPWQSAVSLSTAIELAHKASIIHDDIADGDEIRRERVTIHKKYGIPMALAVSDFLLSSALKQAQSLSPLDGKHLNLFIKTFYSMATGQLNDVAGGIFEKPETKEWGSNHLLKTGSLAALPFEAGAIVGGGSAHEVKTLNAFGSSVGLAFQLINDTRSLLDLDNGRTGLSSDLRNAKITPLVSWARLAAEPHLRTEIDSLLNHKWPLTTHQVIRLKKILIDLGAHEYSNKQAEILLTRARLELAILKDSRAKRIFCAGSTYSTFVQLAFLR
jgi:geranylgeranyl pyrophosphate synthase